MDRLRASNTASRSDYSDQIDHYFSGAATMSSHQEARVRKRVPVIVDKALLAPDTGNAWSMAAYAGQQDPPHL